eukprot:7686831-Pyramimonas_sp.AAC.3
MEPDCTTDSFSALVSGTWLGKKRVVQSAAQLTAAHSTRSQTTAVVARMPSQAVDAIVATTTQRLLLVAQKT